MTKEKLTDYIPEFLDALTTQLEADDKRWGDTWRKRGLKGQERRTMERYRDYYVMFQNNGTPMPWMKIVGGAFICWVRENHPELMTKEEQVQAITQEVADASVSLANRLTDIEIAMSVLDRLALATYCGRKEEFSIAKFRKNMLIVAAYCLSASTADANDVLNERLRQDKIWGDDFDRMNTANDWNAYVTHYIARAMRDGENYSECMKKASGIAQAAILMVDRYSGVAPRHYENLPGAGAKCEKCGRPEGENHVC